jgi:hypothetical protein
MISYLRKQHVVEEKYPFTVKWTDRADPKQEEHTSYFYESSEQAVRQKFFYNRREEDYIVSVERNPIS